MNNTEKKLRTVLKINAAFSLLCGLDAIVFNNQLAKALGISIPETLLYLGIGLLIFSGFVFYNSFKKKMNAKAIRSIIVQDWLWVIGSIIILVFQSFGLSAVAYGVIFVIACIVAVFAIFQAKYLKNTLS